MRVGNHRADTASDAASGDRRVRSRSAAAADRTTGAAAVESPPIVADGGQPCDTDHADRLFDALPDPAILAEFGCEQPRVVAVNDAFARTFGYDAESVAGEPVRELIAPAAATESAVAERMGAGAGSCEVRRETADGDRRDYLFRRVPVDGTSERVYGIYTDITERTAYEASLTALHETARELMAAETADEVFELGVRTAREVLGHEKAAIHRYDEAEAALVPAVTTAETEALLSEIPTFREGNSIAWRAFETGEAVICDNVREDPDVFNAATPVRSEMLFPLGEQGVLLVVSTERAAFEERDRSLGRVLAANVESALRQVERERALRERERALSRQNERLDEFAAVVSHDLRTPLDLAGVHLELAAEGHDGDHLDDIAAAHGRMSELIDDVLAWARDGDAVDATDTVSLPSLVAECWEDRDTDGATLDVATDRTVTADRARLRQLLGNLFDNAIAHAGPDVTVTVGDLDGGFYVADDGSGVPADERERVFEFGHSLSTGRTGIGLAVVGQIVEAHGWSIRLTESADGGARFEVRW